MDGYSATRIAGTTWGSTAARPPTPTAPRGLPSERLVSPAQPRSPLVHPAHASTRAGQRRLLILPLDHHAFGGKQQSRDRRGVLKRGTGDLGRVDDTRLHQVFVRVGERVVAEVPFLRCRDSGD